MADEGLEEGLIRDPGGAEEAHDVAAPCDQLKHPFDGPAAQAPPLATDHDAQIGGDVALQAKPLLQVIGPVEQPLAQPFVEIVAIDQAILTHPGLDPVRSEEIETFDIIHILAVKEFVDIFGRLDRHAVARQHVEMAGAGESRLGRLDRAQGGGDQAPFAPAALDPALDENHPRIVLQRRANPRVIGRVGAGIEVNRHEIAHRRQPPRLGDDPFGVLVTKQDESDFCHTGYRPRAFVAIVGPDSYISR